jgi:hypothetical protein
MHYSCSGLGRVHHMHRVPDLSRHQAASDLPMYFLGQGGVEIAEELLVLSQPGSILRAWDFLPLLVSFLDEDVLFRDLLSSIK